MKRLKFKLILISVLILYFTVGFLAKTVFASTLLQDDFESQNFNNWNIVTGNGSWSVQNIQDSYRLGGSVNTPNTGVEVEAGDFSWSDYKFSVDLLPLSGTDRNLIFRATDQRVNMFNLNLPVSYGLHMYNSHIWLQKFTADNYSEPAQANTSLPLGTPSKITVEALGNNIKVFIDEDSAPIINWIDNDNPILQGKVGLLTTTGASYPTEVWYDNVVVSSLPTETPTPTPTSTPIPTLTPSPSDTPVGKFDLPFSYPGRQANNQDAFKNAFWATLTAAFDHEFNENIFRPFTGQSYIPSDCPAGTFGIKCYDSHNGTDFDSRLGTNVYSVATGKVIFASDHTTNTCTPNSGGFGCVIIIKYQGDHYGLYAHLSKILVNENTGVTDSSLIGQMGETGCPGCGVHLHFGVLKPTNGSNTASSLTRNDWKSLLYAIKPNATAKFRPFCSYIAPNGDGFTFLDPSGWNGSDKDPWSLPKNKGGCGINSNYLWKFNIL